MKKSYLIIFGCLLAIGFILHGCGSSTTEGDGDITGQSGPEDEQPEASVVAPSCLKVFIDGSGSMRDYFGKQNITNITDALTGLNQAVESLDAEYYVWGNETQAIPANQLTQRLINKNLNGKATSFDTIFKKMVGMAPKDTLTVLLSDGIISSASNYTKLSQGFTDYAKGQLCNDIQKALKGSGKAVSIYRMKGSFSGKYLDKSNKPVSYTGDRPFFIFVLGDKENVRDFDKKAREGKIHDIYKTAEVIHLGTAPEMKLLIEPADGEETMASSSVFDRQDESNEWEYSGTMPFRVAAHLPRWVTENYSASVIKRMSKVEIDGKSLKSAVVIDGQDVMFDIPADIVENLQLQQKPWTIRFSISDPALKDWEQYSTNDDTAPDADHTYLLAELISAMHKGITRGQENLIETEMTIVPK